MKKKIFLIFIFIVFIIFILRQFCIVYQNQNNNYFSELNKNNNILNSIDRISYKIHNKEYGLTLGHWGELLLHTFYGYSLVNLYLTDFTNDDFKKFSVEELEYILDYINNDGKKAFIGKNTDIPLGIIYNGHKNQILAALVLLGEEKYKGDLFKNSDYIYLYLNQNKSKNSETYEGWSWYVDNVNAIYSLFITDIIREKDGLNKKYDGLIFAWLKYMKENTGEYGMILSEAETPNLANNQARGPALSWLLTYIYEIDNDLFNSQFKLYNKYFYNLGLSRDIPKGQEQINKIPAGPVVFGYSSSATVLGLSMYRVSNNKERFYDNLKFVDFLFLNNDLEYIFGKSTLIDSLVLWGKTKVSWSDLYKKNNKTLD